jgi:ABC-2 type transport system permease protein
MLVRNRQALFWSLFFPIIFIIIFGLFFGKGSTGISGTVAIINNSKSEMAQTVEKGIVNSKLFETKTETDLSKAKTDINNGRLSAVVVIPSDFGTVLNKQANNVSIYYDPGYSETESVLATVLNNYFTQVTYKMKAIQPIFSLSESKVNGNQTYTYFDFVFVGILGLALMNGSVIGIAVGISKYREDKILKRIVSTPLEPWKFVLAEVFSRLIVNLAQIVLILIVGIYVFGGKIHGSIVDVVLLALLGGILFQLIGFGIAAFSKTADAAQGMAQAITIPMMFLAGIFFPIDSLPNWLAGIVKYLPLAPLLQMLRDVALQNTSPFKPINNFLIILAWIVVLLFIAIKKFKLTEE